MPLQINIQTNEKVGLLPPLSTKNVGDIIKINVAGVPRDFVIAHKGNPSAAMYSTTFDDGIIVITKDIYATKAMELRERGYWDNTDYMYFFRDSPTLTWLNGDFLNTIDSYIRDNIKQVKVPIATSATGYANQENGLSTKVFVPSARELGYTSESTYGTSGEGSILSYFAVCQGNAYACAGRIAHFNGVATPYLLRSACVYKNGDRYYPSCNAGGSVSGTGGRAGTVLGLRPMFVLPSSMSIPE